MHKFTTMQARAMRVAQSLRRTKKGPIMLPMQYAQFGGMTGMGELADRMAAKAQSADDAIDLWETDNRVGILLTLQDEPGALNKALQILSDHNINLTSIQSRPPKMASGQKVMNFNIDFVGNFEMDNVAAAMWRLQEQAHGLTKVGSAEVPWFPLHITDFDNIGKRILSEGDGIQDADHPGFRDPEYRKRRDEIN